jgi:ribosomal protein L11 methyltransferase
MAFGTGTHPSTRMCLRAIEELAGNFQDMEDTSLLDVGTGSGILAIASALLGIKKVVGIDNDYQAVECSIKNANENAVTENVFLSQCPLKKIEGKFSIVAANILPHVLIGMLAELVSSMKDDGFLVLSGILKEKAEEVRVAFLKHLEFVKELNEEEWSCLIFKK